MPLLEDALPMERLSHEQRQLNAQASRHARLLGTAQKLRWGVLQHLGDGQLRQARAQLLHALQLVRAVSETVSATALPLTPLKAAGSAANATGGTTFPAHPAAAASPAAANPANPATEPAPDSEPSTSFYVYPQLQVALGEADTALSLAVVQLHLNDYVRATEHATLALRRYREIKAEVHAALAQLTLSECAVLRGEHAAAEEELRSALRSFRSLGASLGEAEALRMLGGLRLHLGDEIAGRPLLRDAVARYSALEFYSPPACSPFGLAAALSQLGPEHAGEHYREENTGRPAYARLSAGSILVDSADSDAVGLLGVGPPPGARDRARRGGGGGGGGGGRISSRAPWHLGTALGGAARQVAKAAAAASTTKTRSRAAPPPVRSSTSRGERGAARRASRWCHLECGCWKVKFVLATGGGDVDGESDDDTLGPR